VSIERAAQELAGISRASRDHFPARLDANNTTEPQLFVESIVGGLQPTFYTLLGAVAFVLLIACANVASLFLGRLATRQKEIAVRQSLGATRAHVIRQFLVESVVFSTIAGGLGVLLALWA
jgi:ABC-type antimicrobial peptide transport system permease subunit